MRRRLTCRLHNLPDVRILIRMCGDRHWKRNKENETDFFGCILKSRENIHRILSVMYGTEWLDHKLSFRDLSH